MKKPSGRLLKESFTLKGVAGFILNSLQSVFSDLFFGILYLLIFDYLIQYNLPPILMVLCLTFVAVYFVLGVPLWGRWMETCGNTYKALLSEYIFNNALKSSADAHSGVVLSLLQHDVERTVLISGWNSVVLFQAIISGIVSSVIIGVVSWKLFISLVLTGVIPICLDLFCAKKLRRLAQDIRMLIDEKSKSIVDYVNNIIAAKIFKHDSIICKKIIDIAQKIYKKEIRSSMVENISEMVGDLFFSGVFKAIVLIYGMQLVIKNEISIGSLLLCFSMVGGIAFFMGYIGGYIKGLQKILVSVRRVDNFAISDKPNENYIAQQNNMIANIAIDNVAFKYQDSDHFVFDDLNLSLDFPGHYTICGKNGCGKSTLLKLIFGLYLPNNGEIRINCIPTGASPVCYVSQQPLVISGSIRKNLKLNLSTISDADIMQALGCVGLSEWVEGLDSGLSFELDENGNNISKGQKMRISIARALVQRPQLLILDEPDANIDKQTMLLIVDSIIKFYNCSIILVTHTSDKIRSKGVNWKEINLE